MISKVTRARASAAPRMCSLIDSTRTWLVRWRGLEVEDKEISKDAELKTLAKSPNQENAVDSPKVSSCESV